MQKQMGATVEANPLFLTAEPLVKSLCLEDANQIVLSSRHRQDGNSHLFGFVNCISNKIQ